MELSEQLERLSALRDRGLLTPEEFEAQRRIVVARSLSNPAIHASSPSDAEVLASYELFELVGEGGMGRVYRGRHVVAAMAERQGGDVAVKVLHPHMVNNAGMKQRLVAEAEALAQLDHPAIVKVHDLVEDGGRLALVMEWVPGRALSELIGRETGPRPWHMAREMVSSILEGIGHAHARGVIHRDLKPDNIRVTPSGEIKILDFGIARVGDARGRTKTGVGMGTVDYMAPEQFTDARSVDARADIYGLGMTVYAMLAGRLPWEPGDSEFSVMQRKHQGAIPEPTEFYPAIPPWVVAAVMQCLRPNRDERPANVAALRLLLFNRAEDPAPTARAAAQPSVGPTASSRTPLRESSPWRPSAAPAKPSVTPVATPVERDRVGRFGYLKEIAWILVYAGGALYVLTRVDAWTDDGGDAAIGFTRLFGLLGVIVVGQMTVAANNRRLHDVGWSGWWQLAAFAGCLISLPIWTLLFLLPGEASPNRFGPPPSE